MIQTITEMGQALSLPQPGIDEWDTLNDLARAEALIRAMNVDAKERVLTGLQELAERYKWRLAGLGITPPEVVGEVYRKLGRVVLSLRTVEPERSPAWFRAVLLNTAREMNRFNIGRRACESLPSPEVLAELGVYHNDPGSMNNEDRAYIMSLGMRALGTRADRDKAIRLFILHYLDGHSMDDVAEMEDMTHWAVSRSVHRTLEAVKRLAKEIGDS
jgi:DNA-directed RNA polymerase specialized sigma24 family protein